MEIIKVIQEAANNINKYILKTPLIRSLEISEKCNAEVYLKCEHLQYTGSFKLRGATNKMAQLNAKQKRDGVITASTGNHGQGIALAASQLGVPVTIYTPNSASPVKLKAIRELGARIEMVSGDCGDAEITARNVAIEKDVTYISPYNDIDIIAGQGTIGLELYQQMKDLDAVFVSVGGGGLISGIGSYLKQMNPDIQIIGCWPENSPAMYQSIKTGCIVKTPEYETISDGTAGPVEEGSITFPICQKVIDHKVLLTEVEIREAMRLLAHSDRWIVEGAAGVALGGLLKLRKQFNNKKVAVVLCGRNIDFNKYISAVSN